MECKYRLAVSTRSRETVLIETLWNVNEIQAIQKVTQIPVLIETLWNVNIKNLVLLERSEQY